MCDCEQERIRIPLWGVTLCIHNPHLVAANQRWVNTQKVKPVIVKTNRNLELQSRSAAPEESQLTALKPGAFPVLEKDFRCLSTGYQKPNLLKTNLVGTIQHCSVVGLKYSNLSTVSISASYISRLCSFFTTFLINREKAKYLFWFKKWKNYIGMFP